MIDHDKEKRFYFSTQINQSNFFSAFGTKALKATDDLKAVEEFCKNQGISAKLLYRLEQVHSTKIIELKNNEDTEFEEGDGVVTNNKNIALVVRTADCVPIIFSDTKTGYIGISHQGWRGTVNEMAKKMIEKFIENGSHISDIQTAIGPSINMCCFEVQDDVFLEFKTKHPKHFSKVTQIRDNKKYINLLHLNYLQLEDIGLQKNQIEFFPFCTVCNEKDFFSYRRDYKTHYDKFGQQLSFIIKL
jgi:YfiH family protein